VEALAFGTLTTPDGAGRREVELVRLQSSAIAVSIVTLGATLHAVEAPDRDGRVEPICLSLPTADELADRTRNPYLGATCGRWANRIAGARYEVDGRTVELPANDGDAHLHGGPDGFSWRIWDLVAATPGDDGGTVVLALHSPDGDQGHPGAVDVTATYELHGHVLRIAYEATTDAPTAFGLTNHAYWNLAGPAAWEIERSVGDHELRVPSASVLPADERSLPAGPLSSVEPLLLDLRHGPPLLEVLDHHPAGLDHSYAVEAGPDPDHDPATGAAGVHLAAELHHPPTGRTLTVATDQPAIHVYTGNHLAAPFARQAGTCLEAQRFPDAPNRPGLGDAVLRPGEHYRSMTELTFGVR
jgi:aldose 1-epimerase